MNKETQTQAQATNIKWGSHFICSQFCASFNTGPGVILLDPVRVLTKIELMLNKSFWHKPLFIHIWSICSQLFLWIQMKNLIFVLINLSCCYIWLLDLALPHCSVTSIYGSRTAALEKNWLQSQTELGLSPESASYFP